MPTSTVEDYLKAILLREQHLGHDDLVTMGQVATDLEVAPGTVTSMVKTLERTGLIRYEPYSGVRLSDEGRRTAARILRRHRLIELFLVETLGLDWSEVHEEAEQLEHSMSDKLIDRIDQMLGHPAVDPHGDPSPEAEGRIRQPELHNLADCDPGHYAVARVSDQDEAFLRFVERSGLKPGTQLELKASDPAADAVEIQPQDSPSITLGAAAAGKLWVQPVDDDLTEKLCAEDEAAA